MRYFFFIFITHILHYSFAQKNALNNVNKNSVDSIRIKALNDSAWNYLYSHFEVAKQFADSAFNLTKKSKNLFNLSDTYNTLGVLYYISSDFSKSIYFHKKALQIRKSINDVNGLISSYNNLGSCYKELGNYDIEIRYYFKSLYFAKKKNNVDVMAKIYNNIGNAYERAKLYELSAQYNLKALRVYLIKSDTLGIISSYINLSTIKIIQDKFNEADSLLSLCKSYITENTSYYYSAKFFSNYASLLLKTERYKDALKNIQISIYQNEQINNPNSNLVNYINYACILEELNKIEESYTAFEKALNMSKQVGNKLWQKQAYLGLATTSYKLKNFKLAYNYLMSYNVLRDSIFNEEVSIKFALTEAAFINKTNILQNKILKIKNQLLDYEILFHKNRVIITLLLLIIVAITGATLTFYIIHRIKRKNIQKLNKVYEEERNRLSKDLHDELGSDLAKIVLYAEIIKSNPDLVDKLSETSVKINNNVRDLIWFINPENTRVKELFIQLREFIFENSNEFNIDCNIDVICHNNIMLTPKQSLNISRIVKEVINNCIKHSNTNKIKVSLTSNNKIVIQIKDFGKGFDINQIKYGNGINNIQSRAKEIGANVSIISDEINGTEFTLTT